LIGTNAVITLWLSESGTGTAYAKNFRAYAPEILSLF
jgi:hypothetical protein